MRPAGRLKLGFYPLPIKEADRIRIRLRYPEECAVVDPCVGDGIAFSRLLHTATNAYRYGIEIDADRAEQAMQLGIHVIHASAMTVRCPVESISLLYLNPPYDIETGQQSNKRLEFVFLEHSYRWLKAKGVLVFVIPQQQLRVCAKLLAQEFIDLRVYRLTEPECRKYQQVVVLAYRHPRHIHLPDSIVVQVEQELRRCTDADISELSDAADCVYSVPPSRPATLTHYGIPLDKVEDLLPRSAAYRQAARVLIREQNTIKGRPLTPLHGGHVSLLATAGMLNGVFGHNHERHIAHWRSVKFIDHWEETDRDGTVVKHDRERFSHELTLVYADGRSQILTHKKESDEL